MPELVRTLPFLGPLALSVLLIATAAAATPQVNYITPQENQQAKKLYAEGNYAGALELYQRMYRKEPRPVVSLRIGQCHLKLQQWQEAEADLRHFLEAPEDAEDTRYAEHRTEADQGLAEAQGMLALEEARERRTQEKWQEMKDRARVSLEHLQRAGVAAERQAEATALIDESEQRLKPKVDFIPKSPCCNPHPQHVRPRWRIALGTVTIGLGCVVGGFGIGGLYADGRERPDGLVHDTANLGGGLLGLGLAMVGGGTLLIAIPGKNQSPTLRTEASWR